MWNKRRQELKEIINCFEGPVREHMETGTMFRAYWGGTAEQVVNGATISLEPDELSEQLLVGDPFCTAQFNEYGDKAVAIPPCIDPDIPERHIEWPFFPHYNRNIDEGLAFFYRCGKDKPYRIEYYARWYRESQYGELFSLDITDDSLSWEIWDGVWDMYSWRIRHKMTDCLDTCADFERCTEEYVPIWCKDKEAFYRKVDEEYKKTNPQVPYWALKELPQHSKTKEDFEEFLNRPDIVAWNKERIARILWGE